MGNIIITAVKNENELEILRGKSSKYEDFTYTYDQPAIDSLKKHLSLKDSLYVIARQNDVFAGFCSTDTDWWEDGYFFIREILVDPNFQKKGFGEKLMGMCIEHARDNKATGVVTETAFENIPMQRLCAKLHFEKWYNPQWKEGITYKLIF